jgi:hypothetical protein
MRALAEFVMKDRRSAIIAVLLLGLVPMLNLLSPVIVGLTMLRKGWNDALALLVWALLPIGAYAYIGDVVPLILLLGVTLLAAALRQTQSWEVSLLGAVLVGLTVERICYSCLNCSICCFSSSTCIWQRMASKGCRIEELRATLTSFLGATYGMLAALLLILARWMQAALYNPGGFRLEFHSLRIGSKTALLLVGFMLAA